MRLSELSEIMEIAEDDDDDVRRAVAWLAKTRSNRHRKWILVAAILMSGLAAVFFLTPVIQEAIGKRDEVKISRATDQAVSSKGSNGLLEVRSNVANDVVFLGDKIVGSTPLFLELEPGSYVVKVAKEECDGQVATVEIVAGEKLKVHFRVVCP